MTRTETARTEIDTTAAAPALMAATRWAQTTRLVPAVRVVGQMVTLAVTVTAAYWALLLPDSAPAPLVAVAGWAGIPAEALTGAGWPVVAWLMAHLGETGGAVVVTAPLVTLVAFLLLRRGLVTRLVTALAR